MPSKVQTRQVSPPPPAQFLPMHGIQAQGPPSTGSYEVRPWQRRSRSRSRSRSLCGLPNHEPRATLSSDHLRWFYLTRLNHSASQCRHQSISFFLSGMGRQAIPTSASILRELGRCALTCRVESGFCTEVPIPFPSPTTYEVHLMLPKF
jgi:hypothetical protein